MKKKGLIILLCVVAAIVLIIALIAGSYNGMVDKREAVETAQSAISVQLQRRADLIPNFVSTVKGYSDYEKETYTAVTEARSAVAGAKTTEEQQAASARLDGAISVWVNAITEAYPELKANEQYNKLLVALEGSENRISTARIDFNKVVEEYNTSIKKFPKNIFAGIFGFEAVERFENDEGTNKVPEVSFE